MAFWHSKSNNLNNGNPEIIHPLPLSMVHDPKMESAGQAATQAFIDGQYRESNDNFRRIIQRVEAREQSRINYNTKVRANFGRAILRGLGVVGLLWILSENPFFSIRLNLSESLPQHLFLIMKNQPVHRGDFVAFNYSGPEIGSHRPGETFVKIVAGVPGDVVTAQGRQFFIGNQPVGLAKEYSRKGQALKLGPTGVIPQGYLYAMATHPDSFDSRYSDVGWPNAGQLIGRAYPLF